MTRLERQLKKTLDDCLKDKNDILKAHKKDKKYYRTVIKILAISNAITAVELILTLALGKEAIMLTITFAQKIILKIIK
jgi:hypothetical protein